MLAFDLWLLPMQIKLYDPSLHMSAETSDYRILLFLSYLQAYYFLIFTLKQMSRKRADQ